MSDIHQSLHIEPKALFPFLELPLEPHLWVHILQAHASCHTRAKTNSQEALQICQALHQLQGYQWGQDWQTDFTLMLTQKRPRHLLTLVDTFTGWIQTFPTSRGAAGVTAQKQLEHIIPQFYLPRMP